MEEIINTIKKEHPTWVAMQQTLRHPNEKTRLENGKKSNATGCSLEAAALKSITTAQS